MDINQTSRTLEYEKKFARSSQKAGDVVEINQKYPLVAFKYSSDPSHVKCAERAKGDREPREIEPI